MRRVVVRPVAAGDIEDAYEWYEKRQAGLDERFLTALSRTIARVEAQPEVFPVVHRSTRRALVQDRFPYGLFYRIHGDDIVVVACMHARRDPRRWRRRS